MTFPRQRGLIGRAGDIAADAVRRPRRPPTGHAQCPDRGEAVASGLGLTPGRFRRWAGSRVAELTAAHDPCTDRLCTLVSCPGGVGTRRPFPATQPQGCPEHRAPADWRDALAIGWFGSASSLSRTAYRLPDEAGRPSARSRTARAPLEGPGVDWEAVRKAAAHTESTAPLRKSTRAVTAQASLVRKLAGILSGRHCATVHALYDRESDRWSLAWEHPEQARLTHALIAEAAAGDSELEQLLVGHDRLRLADRRLDLVVWARRMAVLDDLVRSRSEKPPRPNRLNRARALLTYNRSYECDLMTEHTEALGTATGRLSEASIWSCLLEAGSAWWWHTRHRIYAENRARRGFRAAYDVVRAIRRSRGPAISRAVRREHDGCEHTVPIHRCQHD